MNVSTHLRAGANPVDNATAAASEIVEKLGAAALPGAAADFLDAATGQAQTVADSAKSVFTGFWNGVAGLLS